SFSLLSLLEFTLASGDQLLAKAAFSFESDAPARRPVPPCCGPDFLPPSVFLWDPQHAAGGGNPCASLPRPREWLLPDRQAGRFTGCDSSQVRTVGRRDRDRRLRSVPSANRPRRHPGVQGDLLLRDCDPRCPETHLPVGARGL